MDKKTTGEIKDINGRRRIQRHFWEERDSTRVKWMGLDRQAERRTHRYAKKNVRCKDICIDKWMGRRKNRL